MKRWKTKLTIRVVSICIFLGCMFYITNFYYQGYANQQKLQSLSAMRNADTESTKQIEEIANGSIENKNKAEYAKLTEILSEFKNIYEKNTDLIGWINLPDTLIDYPVLQRDDNEYYLNHDFYGDISKHGSIFMDCKNDVLLPSTNLILYGHNMKDGTMFSALRKYKDQSFFENHKIISFHTIYEKSQYEIISVFLSKVYLKNEDVFKYYQFVHASNHEEFDEFYHNIKELSLYDTNNEAQYGDTFITLSTCDYTTEDGRLVVVAKKIQTEVEE